MAKQKLKKEELQKIEDIQVRMQAVRAEFGSLALAEIDLKNRKVSVENYLAETQDLENKLVAELTEKYGRGAIDLQAKEFIPEEVPAATEPEKEVVPTVE
jgi:phosphopantetheine adenylyltransferase|tara:strand:+ start:486 stop:785 length:300 start_codon:yes stop_codon:yes gene_type:complete